MPLKVRPSHKLSGELATKALTRHLNPKITGKSFFGKIPSPVFRALKQDPKIAKHLSSLRQGFKAEVPEEIVYRAQEKLAQEKFLQYGVRKDPYQANQGLLKDLRVAEKMPKNDALKFLELGKKDFNKLQSSQTVPEKPRKIEQLQKQIQTYKKFGSAEENQVEALKRQLNQLTAAWLKKKDPTGQELKKYLYSQTTHALEDIKEPPAAKDKVQPQAPPSPPDPLGNIDLAA